MVRNQLRKRQKRYELNPNLVKSRDQFCMIKIQEFPPISRKLLGAMS